jgi:nucleoside-diphosphate-sugar epimerase
MASPSSVFLVGIGYIGQNVLDELLAAKHPVTALVRRPEQASELEKIGVKTVLGTLDNLDLLTAQTVQHEITINTASCDDLPSVEAILSGVRQRVQAGQSSIYIHTSGAGVLEDGAVGMYKNNKIYRDDVPEDIDAIPSTSMHRHVDIPIVQAARELGDKAKIAIILPPLVYGFNPAHQRHSFGLVGLVRFAMKHGIAGYVGEGHNTWSVVHVKDLGHAYTTLLAYIKNSDPDIFQRNPYFFAENGSEISMGEGSKHIARVLYDMGKIQSPQAQTFSEAHYQDVFGPLTPVGLGCNSRSRAIRLRELGWEPRESTDIWTSWKEDEVPSIVAALDSASG